MNSKPFAVFDRHRRHTPDLASPVAMCWAAYMMNRCYGHPITPDPDACAAMSFALPLPDGDVVVNMPLLAMAIQQRIMPDVLAECGGDPQKAEGLAWHGIENEPAEALTLIRDMLQDMTTYDWRELSGSYCAKH